MARKHTTWIETCEGVECELSHEPVEWIDKHKVRVGDKLVIAYAVLDNDSGRDVDDMMGDGMGRLYSFHRHAPEEDRQAGKAAIESDKDAQMLACYEHGGSQLWSLSGSGTQCRWDTHNQAGVWVPDDSLRQQIDSDEAAGLDRAAKARDYCEQFLDTYNDIIAGNVFGCVVEWFDLDGTRLDRDECRGFIGVDYTEQLLQVLKDAFFAPLCAQLKAEAV